MILILLLPLGLLYFTPAIVALARGRQVGVVFVLNVFLGWTLLGWVTALAIAVSSPSAPLVVQPAPGYPMPNVHAMPMAHLPPLPWPPGPGHRLPAPIPPPWQPPTG